MFCESVRDGSFEMVELSMYEPSLKRGCEKNSEVKSLQTTIQQAHQEYVFWYSFNDWLAELIGFEQEVLNELTCQNENNYYDEGLGFKDSYYDYYDKYYLDDFFYPNSVPEGVEAVSAEEEESEATSKSG